MLDKIKRILHTQFQEKAGDGYFLLREDAKEAVCKIAKFKYARGSVLAYKFDKIENGKMIELFPFFTNQKDLKKMCDFILFYENEKGKLFVILCNLKSSLSGTNDKQMKAGQTFADFILATTQRVFGIETYDFGGYRKVHYRSEKHDSIALKAKSQKPITELHLCSNKNIQEECNLDFLCKL
jgi:hypothetical protein